MSSDNQKNYFKLTIVLIAFIFILFARFIPAPAGLSAVGMQVLGLFVGMMILWNFISTDWTSFLCMALLALFEIMTPSAIFASGIGNATIAFLLTFFMISYTLSQAGFSKRLAILFITNPIAKLGPWSFVSTFLFSSVILSSFMSQTAVLLIFLPIAEQLFKELKMEKGDRFPQMIILGLTCSVGIGSANTPIGHAIILIPLQFLLRDTGINVSIVHYSLFGILTGIVIFAALILLYRLVYRPDLTPLKNFDVDMFAKELQPMSKQEKIVATVFGLVIFVWLLQGVLPATGVPALVNVGQYLVSLGAAIPTLIGVVVLCTIHVDGKPVMKFAEAVSKGVPWSGLIFNAAVLVLSASLVLDKVGISQFLITTITPLVNNMSPFVFVISVIGLCTITTQFASNTVCATVFYIIAIPIALAMGTVNVVALACLIGAASSYAYATPPATLPTAIAAGTGWIDIKEMFKYGFPLAIISIIALCFIGYPIANAIM